MVARLWLTERHSLLPETQIRPPLIDSPVANGDPATGICLFVVVVVVVVVCSRIPSRLPSSVDVGPGADELYGAPRPAPGH